MPSVSVIVPVYNGAAFVTDAIESALAQTYTDVEVIAVDDGSTDGTPAALARFGSRIRVHRRSNGGLAAARNSGLERATGTFVALLDADDVWEPGFLEYTVARLATADESMVGVSSGWVLADPSGRPLSHTRAIQGSTFTVRDFLRRCPFPPSTVVVRRAAMRAAGGFDESIRATEDWDLWLRLTVSGRTFGAVDQCLCRYRVHEQNWSHDPVRMRTGGLRTLEKFFAEPALPAALRAEQAPAVAHVHARASSQFYAAGRVDDGAAALREAVQTWPDILLEDETHWAVICADQPILYKGSAQFLDLAQGEHRILTALAGCAGEAVTDPRLPQRALGRAHRALAHLAYAQRRMAAVRRYAIRALRADRSLCLDWRTVGPLLKSFAGAALIGALSRRPDTTP